MIQLKKCCLCYDLRLGNQIIAVFGVAIGLLLIFSATFTYGTPLIETIVMVVLGIVSVVASFSLGYGAAKKHPRAVLAWLILAMIAILCGFISVICEIIASFFSADASISIRFTTFMLICSAIYVYFWICVHSFYEELKGGKYRKDFENVTP